MFMGAALDLTATAVGLVGLIPTWERAKPILDAVPEFDLDKPDPGELTGRIEVSHLTFRYTEDGPLILDDVSLEARPGQFIALVGPSGAGKSTLLRILLGFDLPDSSSVYYDRHDLATIDVTAVRRQIGVVLQSSRLTAGDIYTNIVGSGSYALEDAWDAARMAGFEDEIRAMPMGLHTVVSEGGGTLSGGQRQRLLIARALVTRPRVLLFDEATSALDNRAQQIVSESIDRLHATRIVIAHRLSTIRNADRIYVLDGGRVVQSGTFDELMAEPGLFADLAARQEA
jgi:ABC-type bacteriocin/lantibiotic exporter with double-glycine peptidase domain